MQGVPEVVLRSEGTNGEIGMIRHTFPVGFTGPPLHRHAFDETFYGASTRPAGRSGRSPR